MSFTFKKFRLVVEQFILIELVTIQGTCCVLNPYQFGTSLHDCASKFSLSLFIILASQLRRVFCAISVTAGRQCPMNSCCSGLCGVT